MNVQELTAALAGHAPDQAAVLATFRARQARVARSRRAVAAGLGGMVLVAAVLVAFMQPWAAPARTVPVPSSTVAGGCASVPLPQTLTAAQQAGASVITARGSLTGRSATDGQVYYQMLLSSVRTLSGPVVRSGSTAWVGSGQGPSGPIPGDLGGLWATDGGLFAIVWPAQQTGTAVGPLLRLAPVTAGNVVFSAAGCWDSSGLPSQPFSGALAQTPGSGTYARAARDEFRAVRLAAVTALLASSPASK